MYAGVHILWLHCMHINWTEHRRYFRERKRKKMTTHNWMWHDINFYAPPVCMDFGAHMKFYTADNILITMYNFSWFWTFFRPFTNTNPYLCTSENSSYRCIARCLHFFWRVLCTYLTVFVISRIVILKRLTIPPNFVQFRINMYTDTHSPRIWYMYTIMDAANLN